MATLQSIIEEVKNHAMLGWRCAQSVAYAIAVTKIDFTVDLEGSFMPAEGSNCRQVIHELLNSVVPQIFMSDDSNFLSLSSISDFRVRHGSNNLDTCLQYEVVNNAGEKILNVKFYDKVLDLIARDGYLMVGSRIGQVIGFSGEVNALTKRLLKAEKSGVCRLEISIHRHAFATYRPWQPSVKTRWPFAIPNALSKIVKGVLGDKRV